MLSAKPLFSELASCLKKDQFLLKKRLHGAVKITDAAKQQQVLEKIQQAIAQSQQKKAQRLANLPTPTYPEELPVSQKKQEIKNAIANHQVVIVAGETGSGKTTQLPKICLELGRGVNGLIGHTQPRRLAARSVANRIADELNSPLGETVGFKIRFSDQVTDNSYIKLMTDGILLAEIQQDRFLNQYDTIIIDEAHERSLNIDFILGYLKNLLPKRPDLKVIITSATIDPERFSRHFNHAPIIEVSGRTYPVEVRYRPLIELEKPEQEDEQLQGIFNAIDELSELGRGDILIFLNGEREIRDTADALAKRQLKHTEVLPLYARLSNAEQNRIFSQGAKRRIVLSTNVAETSLTVPGIRYVIDTGTARISRYSYRTKVQRLPIEAISQASANQRKGRCGRVEAGVCIRLYSEEDFLSRPEFTDPEILRTNLASVILQMLGLGLGEISQFPFVQPPDSRNITDGIRLLEELEAVKPASRHGKTQLTKQGRDLARIPLDPRLAKMVLSGANNGALKEVIIIAAALAIQDPRERPQLQRAKADELHQRFDDTDSDFTAFLNLWHYLAEQQHSLSRNQFSRLCKKEFFAVMRVREWQDIVYQISQTCDEMGLKANTAPASGEQIHQAILSGLLSHIGLKDEKHFYKGARNSQFHIFPASSLFKKRPKWVMSAELVETAKLYARVNAKIDVAWLANLAQHLVKRSHSEPHWEKKAGAVIAFEQQTLYGLIIVSRKRVQYSHIDAKASREIFIRSALVEQQLGAQEAFLHTNQQLIDQVHELESKARRRDILIDEQQLFDFYAQKVPENITDRAKFLHWWKGKKQQDKQFLTLSREQLMRHEADNITAASYPDVWAQGDILLPLRYQFEPSKEDDGVAVQVPLALLNQIKEEGFDWHIPALRHELICALIKSLPKAQRRNFVPAPNYADAVLEAVTPLQGTLLDALCLRLLRMTGVKVAPEDFDLTSLDKHLRLAFEVRDEHHTLLARGYNLSKLKAQLAGKVSHTLSKVADKGIEKDSLTEWNFADLPHSYVKKQGQYEIKAYVALTDKKSSTAIELFDSPAKAQAAHQLGLRRLVLLNVPSPIKYLQQHLPNKAKLGLYFNPFGKIDVLIDDCIQAATDKLLASQGEIRSEEKFTQAKEVVRAELGDTVVHIAKQVEQVLSIAHRIHKRMRGKVDLTMITAHGDIKSQLEQLVFKGFVSTHGADKMGDLIRYLSAIEKRLEKLPVDPNRDRLCTLELEKVAEAYQKCLSAHPKNEPQPQALRDIFWQQQELRVSLFAQTLGTPYPVSAKRVLNAIKELN